jgi:progressive ankylosis protein
MMSVEGPYIAAIVARMPDAVLNLAAYGVAFALAWMAEAPIMMLLTASNALVRDRQSFLAMKRFTYTLVAGTTLLVVLANVPPVFRFFMHDVMAVPDNVADLVHIAMLVLVPWPGAIGYRRFYQGILVRHRMTRRVAYGTIIRLTSMSATAGTLAFTTSLHGSTVGAIALTAGVVSEAIASRWMARHLVASLLATHESMRPVPLTQRSIAHFYYPLAMTSIISMTTGPILTFFMGHSRNPIESLALLPIVQNMVFMFRSGGVAYQEVGVALTGDHGEHEREVARGALVLGVSASLALGVLTLTPLLDVWLLGLSGLTPALAAMAVLPVRLLVLMPLLEYLLAFQRSRIIVSGGTRVITMATTLEVTSIAVVLLLCTRQFGLMGVVAGSVAGLSGRAAANAFLFFARRARAKVTAVAGVAA